MIQATLQRMITSAIAALHEQATLVLPPEGIPAVEIEHPQHIQHGDFATNIAMKLARPPKSREIAQQIADYLNEVVGVVPAYALVQHVEVAGPGFINIRLQPGWILQQSQTIIAQGPTAGAIDIGRQQRINLEFVSANPTGLVHIGNGRGGFIGDTLGNVMRAAGYDVTKEYYFNDYGQQINVLGSSIEWYIRQSQSDAAMEKPVNGYFDSDDDPDNQYYQGIARRITADSPDIAEVLAAPESSRQELLGHRAAQYIISDIKNTMQRLNINFDVWFHQASLESSGELQSGIDELRKRGFLYEADGATWMETTRFGDDKDRVLIKSDGNLTYIASDIAYVLNKLNRGFDRLIYVLGADHHGYIGRLKATAQMFGYAPDSVHVLIYQQVNLKVDGVSKRMSKRAGTLVTLDELVDVVGSDITRFFYLMRAGDTHLEFDLQLAMREGDDNPGLTVQYGHARTAGVLRKALEAGFHPETEAMSANMHVLLEDTAEELQSELALMRELLRLEEIIERVAISLEPHHLTKYGMDVAAVFHIFYDRCNMLRANPATRAARFALTIAARTVLARVLTLLGMSAPERMERADQTTSQIVDVQ